MRFDGSTSRDIDALTAAITWASVPRVVDALAGADTTIVIEIAMAHEVVIQFGFFLATRLSNDSIFPIL